jgi:transcriptional regulator with XRE-family HTH domain
MSTVVTSEETRQIVSGNLKKILDRLKISQGDLARRLFPGNDVDIKHRVQVSRWVNGKVLPSSADIVNLAEVLDVKVTDILQSPKTEKNL